MRSSSSAANNHNPNSNPIPERWTCACAVAAISTFSSTFFLHYTDIPSLRAVSPDVRSTRRDSAGVCNDTRSVPFALFRRRLACRACDPRAAMFGRPVSPHSCDCSITIITCIVLLRLLLPDYYYYHCSQFYYWMQFVNLLGGINCNAMPHDRANSSVFSRS